MIPGYELIEEVAGGETFQLFRARRSGSGMPALVKQPRHQPARLADIAALRREIDTLASLPISGVLKLLALDHHAAHALVAEDPGGVQLTALMATDRPALALGLAVGIELAKILEALHRRGLQHNGIRPEVILCDPVRARVWLIDFSDVSGDAEPHGSLAQHMSASRLTYASPEQTGRMNRAVDNRSDLYSLGIVLYELFTGAPPFRSDDVLEQIHGHIARVPTAPTLVNPGVPAPVSGIVLKLLAKTAEDRYQTAAGLRRDLELCLESWTAHGAVAAFPLASHDISDHLLLSRKLYGREREVAALLAAFDRLCQGRPAKPLMMVVAGYSGIGKTSLIQELYRPIVRQRGYFISGKFDQVVRNIPFGALIQAFRALVRQLLTENELRLAQWAAALGAALGANGGVLAEVIPEIEFIVGEQPIPATLDPTQAQNRFRLVFQNFVAALARPEHPLVVFLDDLQWADAATLSLIEPLVTSQEIQSLFLMGAYRDNEVDAAHPLLRTLVQLESAGVELQRVVLGPLRLPELTELIHDNLHGDAKEAESLARLVLEKTGGNPFFVTQFLQALRAEGYLKFDYAQGRWDYRITAIARAPLTDNVVDLMTRKIQRLPERTQRALTLAACIGSPFDTDTLAIVSEQSPAAVADDLRNAVIEGLLVPAERAYESTESAGEPSGFRYAFLHDRVQQSAYGLIPEERRQHLHLTVGRLLRTRAEPRQIDDGIFDIVHHLNLGRCLIVDEAERVALARFNLNAGKKAKSSTAHDAALRYLQAGLSLLGSDHWQTEYDLAFALNIEAAESHYLCGNFDVAEQSFALLLKRATTSLDRGRVYRLRGVQYEYMSCYADALASAREGLILFGISFPDSAEEKEAALDREVAAIHELLAGRSIASLVELPVMTDLEIRMVMNILTDMWSSAYILGDPVLARLISAKMVRLSLMHGNVEESAYGYVTHAITIGPARGDYETAYEFGRLALAVNERFHDSRRRAKIHQQFHAHVNFWRQPWHTCIPYAREACRSGLESGDFLYAAYGAGTETWSAILANQDLERFVRDYSPNVALIRKLKNTGFADATRLMLNWVRALQGKTRSPLSLSDDSLDERDYEETYRGNPFFSTFHAVARLHVCYLMGAYPKALHAARIARETVYQVPGTVWPVIFEFWNALTLAANYADAKSEARPALLDEMEQARDSYRVLAENCPENFLCHSLLISAEIERVGGRFAAARDFYDDAIRYAGDTRHLQHQALANELGARFRLEIGEEAPAAILMAEARACYAQWGATAKVAELERRHGALFGRESAREPAVALTGRESSGQVVPATNAGALDLSSVMKAAQAIAGEIELDRLLARLMRIAIENAGAQYGSLVLEQHGELLVQAEGSPDSVVVKVHDGVPLAEARNLPTSIINYVRRTSESVVLADARLDDRYGGDPYIVRNRPRSVMCVPVLKQGLLIGVFYLENSVVSDAFTPDRIQVMQALSTEAAISLENARLVDGLKREIQERKEAQEALRKAADELRVLNDLVEQTNQPIAIVGFDGRFVRCNRAYEQLTGYGQEELRGMNFRELTPPPWHGLEEQQVARLQQGLPICYEKEYRRKNGTLISVEIKADVLRSASGEAVNLYAFATDITGRKREQETLRSITEGTAAVTGGDFFYSLVRVLASALEVPYAFVTECRDQKRACSLAFWKRDGFGANFQYDVAGTPCHEVVGGQVCYYFDNLQQRFPLDRDLVDLGAESYLGVPMFDASGHAIGHLAVLDAKPMTEDARKLSILRIFASRGGAELERLRADEGLRGALAEVQALKNELEVENTYLRRDLIANVSHDLRTPLASLRGYLETLLIKEDKLSPVQRRDYLGIAVRQSEHLANLIDELFELAKLDFRGVELNREPLHLGELASDVVQKFQLAAESKQISLAIDAPARMPLVRADVSLVERVFENLIGNALQHTPGGGCVTVSLGTQDGHVLTRVADNGSGISETELPYIFERFYRGEKSRTAKTGGAGLGLAITKRILELHNSEIMVESRLGSGTCFSFGLPYLTAERPA